jgi:hypothetical protein
MISADSLVVHALARPIEWLRLGLGQVGPGAARWSHAQIRCKEDFTGGCPLSLAR